MSMRRYAKDNVYCNDSGNNIKHSYSSSQSRSASGRKRQQQITMRARDAKNEDRWWRIRRVADSKVPLHG